MKRTFLFFLAALVAAPMLGQQSRNGEFAARVHTRTGAKSARDYNTWTATIVDRSGKQRYRIVKDVAFDVQFPSLALADNGVAIVVHSFEGVVEFFDARGVLSNTLLPFGTRTHEYEQNIKCSLEGERAAFLFSSTSHERATVLMTDLRGNELWRAQLKGTHAGEIFLSRGGQYLASGSYTVGNTIVRATEVFDRAGKQVASFSFLFRHADITEGSDIVLVEREKALFGSLRVKRTPVQWFAEGSNQVITGARFLGKAQYVALIVETVEFPRGKLVYRNPNLLIVNRHGKEVARKKLVSSSPTPAQLTVKQQEVQCNTSSAHATLSFSSLK
jgi:hypothetical protein